MRRIHIKNMCLHLHVREKIGLNNTHENGKNISLELTKKSRNCSIAKVTQLLGIYFYEKCAFVFVNFAINVIIGSLWGLFSEWKHASDWHLFLLLNCIWKYVTCLMHRVLDVYTSVLLQLIASKMLFSVR